MVTGAAKVSVISLIYQSAALADWVHESVHRFTPMIARGEAEFFFVANDPTPGVIAHLDDKGYSYIVNVNRRYSNEALFELGYGGPEHMSRVYRGYNQGLRHSHADYVVLVNSDNYFSPDWLENLLKYSDRTKVISSKLVERYHPTFGVFPGALHGEFGDTAATFDETAFLDFVMRTKKTGLEKGGAYMPSLFHRDIAIEAGLYPSGNVAGQSFDDVARYGDEAFFDRLNAIGVSHYTALDSISYHLKEGERADTPNISAAQADVPGRVETVTFLDTPALPYPSELALERIRDSMAPGKRHQMLLESLSGESQGDVAIETLRRVVASGSLVGEQAERAQAELAALEAARVDAALAAQALHLRRMVVRIVGNKRADLVIAVIHSLSWVTRPIRRALARRS